MEGNQKAIFRTDELLARYGFAAQLRDSKRVGVKTPHSKLLCGARALASRTINAMQYLDCIVN